MLLVFGFYCSDFYGSKNLENLQNYVNLDMYSLVFARILSIKFFFF